MNNLNQETPSKLLAILQIAPLAFGQIAQAHFADAHALQAGN